MNLLVASGKIQSDIEHSSCSSEAGAKAVDGVHVSQGLSQFMLSRLRRVTTGARYFPEVDGVRFVAIALVLIQHMHERVIRRTQTLYPTISEHFFAIAGPGVNIFFALSGFILYRGLKKSLNRTGQLPLKQYFLRRLTRLEPPYIIVMTSIAIYLAVIGYDSPHVRQLHKGPDSLLAAWAASMTYTYCLIFGSLPKLNGVAWSLETEVQFYILAPILAIAVFQLPVRIRPWITMGVAVLWAGTVTCRAADTTHFSYSIAVYMPAFLAGIAVEELTSDPRCSDSRRVGVGADILAVISLLVLFTLRGKLVPLLAIGRAIAIFGALGGMLSGTWARKALSLAWVSAIGGMCYTIYLIHMPILEIASKLTTRVGVGLPYPVFFLIQCVLLLTCVLIPSIIFFLLVERPCMDHEWPRKLMAFLRGHFLLKRNIPVAVTSPSDAHPHP